MKIQPCIHIEGPDGSGKTTLVKWMADRLGFPMIPTDDPPKSWEECLARIERRVHPGLVCDRSSGLISELVYGPVLRGGTIVPEDVMWKVVETLIREAPITFVYCRPPEEALNPSFRPEEDPRHVEGVKSRQSQLVARYDEVMAQVSRMGGRVIRYDRTRQTPEEVVACVE